ncbi:fasciclin domain-containing protein [Pedobacter glucosidilyticus]|uniref:fasciclin domain-containing protein n=1 Tax=Pedobacter glucosidilyticus TaxID=1122941 RepID=UPI0006869D6F|nr:fasciclin domain-containing protein [Pedobacter glucosidilyticus]
MKINRFINSKLAFGLIALAAATGFSSCNKENDAKPTVAQVAVSMPGFTQLEAAAIRGGVAIALSNKNPNDPSGNYTVFAPTNDAFARLGLVNPQDLNVLQKPFLTNVLLYHVSSGSLNQTQVMSAGNIPSLITGVTKKVIVRNNEYYINGSKILATDVQADNGIVHVIDKVLLATGADIVGSAVTLKNAQGFITPELSFLVEAVLYADLAGALTKGPGTPSFTVFAPTDQAFKDLGVILGVPLNVPADIRKLPKDVVTNVLLNHVIADGGKFTSELFQGTLNPLLTTSSLTLGAYNNGVLPVSGRGNAQPANMVIPDIQTTNGVVHIIDRVLLP